MVALDLLERTLDYEFFLGKQPAIPTALKRGLKKSKLIIAAGENATGKSLYRRLVQIDSQQRKVECIHISVEGRRSVAYSPWLAFVYGDEENNSTGANSASTILGGIKTSRSREEKHVLVFDEPDLGMSEGACMGAGAAIAEFLSDAPENLEACVIITHSRHLLDKLRNIPHHFLHFGEEEYNIDSWVSRPVIERSLEELKEANTERFRGIQKIINERKKKKS